MISRRVNVGRVSNPSRQATGWKPVLQLAWSVIVLSALTGIVHGDETAAKADEATLRDAGLKADGPGLLAYLRKQTPSEEDNARLAETVRRLGDRSYAVREQASRELLSAE